MCWSSGWRGPQMNHMLWRKWPLLQWVVPIRLQLVRWHDKLIFGDHTYPGIDVWIRNWIAVLRIFFTCSILMYFECKRYWKPFSTLTLIHRYLLPVMRSYKCTMVEKFWCFHLRGSSFVFFGQDSVGKKTVQLSGFGDVWTKCEDSCWLVWSCCPATINQLSSNATHTVLI